MPVPHNGHVPLVVAQASVIPQDRPASGALCCHQQAGEEPEEHHRQPGKIGDAPQIEIGHHRQGKDAVYQQDLEDLLRFAFQPVGAIHPQDIIDEDRGQPTPRRHQLVRPGGKGQLAFPSHHLHPQKHRQGVGKENQQGVRRHVHKVEKCLVSANQRLFSPFLWHFYTHNIYKLYILFKSNRCRYTHK